MCVAVSTRFILPLLTVPRRWIIHLLIAIYPYPSLRPFRFTVLPANRLGAVQYCPSRTTEVWVCLETATSVHRGLAFIRGTANLLRTTSTLVATNIRILPLSVNPVSTDITSLDPTTVQIPNINPFSPSHSTRLHHPHSFHCRLISTAGREAGKPASKVSDSHQGLAAPVPRRTKIPICTQEWHGTRLHHLPNRWAPEAAGAVISLLRGF